MEQRPELLLRHLSNYALPRALRYFFGPATWGFRGFGSTKTLVRAFHCTGKNH